MFWLANSNFYFGLIIHLHACCKKQYREIPSILYPVSPSDNILQNNMTSRTLIRGQRRYGTCQSQGSFYSHIHSSLPHPWLLETTDLISISIIFVISRMLCKWNHTVRKLWGWAFYTQRNSLETHPDLLCVSIVRSFLLLENSPWYGWIMVCLIIHWRTCGLYVNMCVNMPFSSLR